MGTNYWLTAREPCPACGREYAPLHVGKSSAGWCFALHVEPAEGIHDLDDWRVRFAAPGAIIRDEYGRVITAEEMLAEISKRKQGVQFPAISAAEAFSAGGLHVDPASGLIRHRLGDGCIKHGDGPWDCVMGEFS